MSRAVGFASVSTRVCLCDSGQTLEHCCKPLIEGANLAGTAVQLMRSRYTAYVLLRRDYLLATWHPSTRPPVIQMDHRCKWLGLKIIGIEAGASDDQIGVVAFVARYKIAGKAHRLVERSRFVRSHGRWCYLKACAESA